MMKSAFYMRKSAFFFEFCVILMKILPLLAEKMKIKDFSAAFMIKIRQISRNAFFKRKIFLPHFDTKTQDSKIGVSFLPNITKNHFFRAFLTQKSAHQQRAIC